MAERKKRSANGSAQKMFSFRLDNDLAEFLNKQGHKGHFLNTLIREEMEKCLGEPETAQDEEKPAEVVSLSPEVGKAAQNGQNEVEQAVTSKDVDVMERYQMMKKKHPQSMILFRNGKMYEVFDEDARKVHEAIPELLLTRYGKMEVGPEWVEFKHSMLDVYLPKLVRAGVRVAICDLV